MAEFTRILAELESQVKDNVIATLSDGTVVAVPKVAPVAEELAEGVLPVEDKGGKAVITKPQAGVTVTTTAKGSQTTYSRVERAKALPQTGEKESLLALAGVALLSSLGLASARRKRQA